MHQYALYICISMTQARKQIFQESAERKRWPEIDLYC